MHLFPGAGGRNRTDTLSPEPDFESGASTSSTTPAKSGSPYRRTGRVVKTPGMARFAPPPAGWRRVI